MKFYISVTEMRSKVVEVESEEIGAALAKVEEAYYNDEIYLGPGDILDGVELSDETEAWRPLIEIGYETRFQEIK